MSGSPVVHHPAVRQNQAAVGWKTRFPGEIGHARLNISVNEEAAGSAVAVATDLPHSWICLLEKHPVLILKISSNGKFTAATGLGSQALIGGTCSKSVPPALFHWKIQTLSPTVDFSQKLKQNMLGGGAGAREGLDNIGTALFTPSGQIFTFSHFQVTFVGKSFVLDCTLLPRFEKPKRKQNDFAEI